MSLILGLSGLALPLLDTRGKRFGFKRGLFQLYCLKSITYQKVAGHTPSPSTGSLYPDHSTETSAKSIDSRVITVHE